MRTKLLDFQRSFYQNASDEARRDSRKAFIVGEKHDRARLLKFVEMAQRQGVKLFETKEKITAAGVEFEPGSSYIIPLEQPQYKLILGMFQRDTTFTDSIFYDISAWTLPLAFNLHHASLSGGQFSQKLLGNEAGPAQLPDGQLLAKASDYAFAFEWDAYHAPAALYFLLKKGLLVKTAAKPFTATTAGGQREFGYGTILVPTQNQKLEGGELLAALREAAQIGHLTVHGLTSGLTGRGIDLGSSNFEVLKKPNVLLLTGEGVTPMDAGEIWHLLDTRYEVPVTKADLPDVNAAMLEKYNVVIMPNGGYGALNAEAIKAWVSGGGTLVAVEGAVKWLETKQIGSITLKKEPEPPATAPARRPYDGASEDRAATELPGTIFEAELDLSHPLCYGFRRKTLPVFRGSGLFCEATKNPYATPLALTRQPLMAGYVPKKLKPMAPGSPSAAVTGVGAGRIICLMDNPCFRAFWYGTDKLMANAVFFGSTIASQTLERK